MVNVGIPESWRVPMDSGSQTGGQEEVDDYPWLEYMDQQALIRDNGDTPLLSAAFNNSPLANAPKHSDSNEEDSPQHPFISLQGGMTLTSVAMGTLSSSAPMFVTSSMQGMVGGGGGPPPSGGGSQDEYDFDDEDLTHSQLQGQHPVGLPSLIHAPTLAAAARAGISVIPQSMVVSGAGVQFPTFGMALAPTMINTRPCAPVEQGPPMEMKPTTAPPPVSSNPPIQFANPIAPGPGRPPGSGNRDLGKGKERPPFKRPKVMSNLPKLKSPITFVGDTDINKIPIMKEGMARCERCGAIGVKHAFYTKERKFCSLACARKIPSSTTTGTASETPGQSTSSAVTVPSTSAVRTVPLVTSSVCSVPTTSISNGVRPRYPSLPPPVVKRTTGGKGPPPPLIPRFLAPSPHDSPNASPLPPVPSCTSATLTLVSSTPTPMPSIPSIPSIQEQLKQLYDPSNILLPPSTSSSPSGNTVTDVSCSEASLLPPSSPPSASLILNSSVSDLFPSLTSASSIMSTPPPSSFSLAPLSQPSSSCNDAFKQSNGPTPSEEGRPSKISIIPSRLPLHLQDTEFRTQKPKFDLARSFTYELTSSYFAASVSSFKHVPLKNIWDNIQEGMKVEVQNDADKFWVATVLRLAGYYALLRFVGFQEDPSQDRWINLGCDDVFPVGHCATLGKSLVPPKSLHSKDIDWRSFLVSQLTGARTLPANFNSEVRGSLQSKVRVGMRVEVVDRDRLSQTRVATVAATNAGRLHLRYQESPPEDPGTWSHEASPDLHVVGWSLRVGHDIAATEAYLTRVGAGTVDPRDVPESALIQPRRKEPVTHPNTGAPLRFAVGHKLEAIDPLNGNVIGVATVARILYEGYMMLRMEHHEGDPEELDAYCRHETSPYIFPAGFCDLNGIDLTPPRDWPHRGSAPNGPAAPPATEGGATGGGMHSGSMGTSVTSFSSSSKAFNWLDYLKATKSTAAPVGLFQREVPNHGFRVGMKLECVDSRCSDPKLVCVATVTRVIGRLLRIRFDGWETDFDQWLDCESPCIFPVGWCHLARYPLQPPGPETPEGSTPPRKGSQGKRRREGGELVLTGAAATGQGVEPQGAKRPGPGRPRKTSVKKDLAQEKVWASTKVQSFDLKGKGFEQKVSTKVQSFDLKGKGFDQKVSTKVQSFDLKGKGFDQKIRQNGLSSAVEVSDVALEEGSGRGPLITPIGDGNVRVSSYPAASKLRTVPIAKQEEKPPGEREEKQEELQVDSPGEKDPPVKNGVLEEAKKEEETPQQWSVADVAEYLKKNDCGAYAEAFRRRKIDGRQFLSLTRDGVLALTGMKVGPSLKITELIQQLKFRIDPSNARKGLLGQPPSFLGAVPVFSTLVVAKPYMAMPPDSDDEDLDERDLDDGGGGDCPGTGMGASLLAGFLFGNIDREGRLDEDDALFDSDTRGRLGSLEKLGGLLGNSVLREMEEEGKTAGKGEGDGGGGDTATHGEVLEVKTEKDASPEGDGQGSEDFSEINELAEDESDSVPDSTLMPPPRSSHVPSASGHPSSPPPSAAGAAAVKEEGDVKPALDVKPVLSSDGAVVAASPLTAEEVDAQHSHRPLANMLPEKYKDVDVRELFPEFRPNQTLRFSRLFGPAKASCLPQIWRNVKHRRKRRPPAAAVAKEEDQKPTLDGTGAVVVGMEEVNEDDQKVSLPLCWGTDKEALEEAIRSYPKELVEESDEVRLTRPVTADSRPGDASGEAPAEASVPSQAEGTASIKENMAWRFGPSQLWFDMLDIPDSGEGFSYSGRDGSPKKSAASRSGEETNGGTSGSQAKNPILEQGVHIPDDAFLMMTQSNWEDDIIWDSENYEPKKHKQVSLPAGWIPSGSNRTAPGMTLPVKASTQHGSGVIEQHHSPSKKSSSKKNKQSVFQEDPDETYFSVFPVENEELILGNWEEKIIWDPQNLPACLQTPSIPSLDPNDENIILDIPEDVDPSEDAQQTEGKAKKIKIPHPHVRKSKLLLGKAGVITQIEEDSPPPPTKQPDKDPYNISNDEFYDRRTEPSLKSSVGGTLIQHSLPVMELQSPFIPTHLGPIRLRQFHRPQLKRYSHGPMSHPGAHPVYPLTKDIDKKAKQRHAEVVSSGGGDVFFMREPTDLTGGDGEMLMMEYAEEHPPLVMQVGMCTKIKNYFKRRAEKESGPPSHKYGDTAFSHTSPFLGVMHPGQSIQTLENNLFRAPIYPQKVPDSMFLVIRTRYGYSIRTVDALYTVGQECPLYEVPGPNSKRANNFVRDFLQCCAYFSMIAAEQRLRDAGYGDAFILTQAEEDDEDIQLKMDDEVKCAPWNTTRAYIQAVKGKCLLQLAGPGDPTGCGEGFSYIRVPNKPQTNKEEIVQEKRIVTGTDADLRRLPLHDAKGILRKYGVPEVEINKLSRWEVIDVVRTLSTEKAKAGEEGMNKFSRGNRFSVAELQERYREDCQRIFDLQNKVLCSQEELSTDEGGSSSDEDGSDMEELGKNIEKMLTNKKTSSQAHSAEPGAGEAGAPSPQAALPTQETETQAEPEPQVRRLWTGESRAPLVPLLLMGPPGSCHCPSPPVPSQLIAGRGVGPYVPPSLSPSRVSSGFPQRPPSPAAFVLESGGRLLESSPECVSPPAPRRKLLCVPRVHWWWWTECLGCGESAVAAVPAKQRKQRQIVQCSSCGIRGHMKTNKACPNYSEPNAAESTSAAGNDLGDVTLDEDDTPDLDSKPQAPQQDVIYSEGTKVRLSGRLVKQAEAIKRKALRRAIPKKTLVPKKRRRSALSSGTGLEYLEGKKKAANRQRIDPLVALSTILESILNEMRDLKEASPFMQAVSARLVPDYHLIISQPMDLQTMREKIHARQYSSREEFLEDMKLMVQNSIRYNGAGHTITIDAKALLDLCVRRFQEKEDRLMRLEKAINPLLDDDSSASFSFILDSVVQSIKAMSESFPFLKAVDRKKVKDYYELIKTPMDIGEIEKNAKGRKYRTRAQFLGDVAQIYENSRTYNGVDSEYTTKAAKLLQAAKDTLAEFESHCETLEEGIRQAQERALDAADSESLATSTNVDEEDVDEEGLDVEDDQAVEDDLKLTDDEGGMMDEEEGVMDEAVLESLPPMGAEGHLEPVLEEEMEVDEGYDPSAEMLEGLGKGFVQAGPPEEPAPQVGEVDGVLAPPQADDLFSAAVAEAVSLPLIDGESEPPVPNEEAPPPPPATGGNDDPLHADLQVSDSDDEGEGGAEAKPKEEDDGIWF
ncbi:unnamed protein product [Cyprideis torosa]|uniref:Transcription initiation factor TFIID subunit 1 n=1 Tax=Cyprideis torosa TaxID=163714 RepID=A0A7R8ZG07_9CRUS|nr:unnamed protein product [Cyprideis torosa]CAG0880440.1 unnamed protein product [Cyprideis torosa]